MLKDQEPKSAYLPICFGVLLGAVDDCWRGGSGTAKLFKGLPPLPRLAVENSGDCTGFTGLAIPVIGALSGCLRRVSDPL